MNKTALNPTEENYNMLIWQAKHYTQQAREAENAGDKTTVQALRITARQSYERAEEMAKYVPIGVTKTPAHAGKKKPRTKKATPGSRSGRELAAYDMIASVFRGMEKVTGGNYAAKTIQHVTTEAECRECLEVYRAMFTFNGKLDKEGYCRALNTTRGNILFTARQLTIELNDARRSGDTKGAEAYETMINIQKNNAGIIADEIRKNGGKVDQEG